MKIIKNSIVDRFEIVQDSAVAYFQQISEQLKAKYDTWTIINILGKKIVYRIGKFIPNYEDVIRRFTKQEDNVLIDSIADNDASKILPVSTILTTSVAEFTDLSGVTITSYSGDQLLSISGNNIISSGTGFVFDLLLSDGTFIPFLHLKTDVSGNENHILNITDVGKEYRLLGSTYLQEKGNVERLEELVVDGDFPTPNVAWIAIGESSIENGYGRLYSSSGAFASIRQENVFEIGKEYTVTYIGISSNDTPLTSDAFGGVTMPNSIGINEFTGVATQTGFQLKRGAAVMTLFEFTDVSVKLASPEIIPNKPDGTRTVEGGTFIAGGGMMNLTDCLVRLYEVGDVDVAKTFFDKSNALIWKQTVRDSIYYDASNTGYWHTSELTQQYIYDNIQDAYKYRWWSKINSLGVFKDLFLYPVSLSVEDAVKAGKYVGSSVLIPYEVTEGNYQVTEGDYLVTP